MSVLRPGTRARQGRTTGVVRQHRRRTRWVPDQIEDRYRAAEQTGQTPPTAHAILVRTNEDSRAAGRHWPPEVSPRKWWVSVGCCMFRRSPIIVAMLRLVADPLAGSAAMRLLTGPRWRLGAKDIDALWRRARGTRGGRRLRVVGCGGRSRELDKALDAVLPPT